MDSQKVFICECGSYKHQAIFWFNKDDKELQCNIHLITHRNIFKRIWVAIRYIFGYKSNYGDWDSFCFKSIDEERLLAYLNKANLTFKQQLEMDYIPRVKEMITREERFLDTLKSFPKSEENDDLIKKSIDALNRYRTRHDQYVEYAKNLEG